MKTSEHYFKNAFLLKYLYQAKKKQKKCNTTDFCFFFLIITRIY